MEFTDGTNYMMSLAPGMDVVNAKAIGNAAKLSYRDPSREAVRSHKVRVRLWHNICKEFDSGTGLHHCSSRAIAKINRCCWCCYTTLGLRPTDSRPRFRCLNRNVRYSVYAVKHCQLTQSSGIDHCRLEVGIYIIHNV